MAPGDARALGRALAEVLADPLRRATLVENGAERAEDFSMQRLADEYLERYARAIATHSAT